MTLCSFPIFFPGFISLLYFGGPVATTWEITALTAATNLVLWIPEIYPVVHKYLLPGFNAAYFLSSNLSLLLVKPAPVPRDICFSILWQAKFTVWQTVPGTLALPPLQSCPRLWRWGSVRVWRESGWEDMSARREERREGGREEDLNWLDWPNGWQRFCWFCLHRDNCGLVTSALPLQKTVFRG